MNNLLKVLILLTFLTLRSHATTFIPTAISERINYSDGLIAGTYLGSSVKKLPNGQVTTELSFSVEQIAGISPSSIVNRNNFKILVPGGSWNGNVHKVSGTPTFERGEKVVLMVSQGPFGFIMPDLSLSKFNYKMIDGEKYLVSPIFSNKEGVGKISFEEIQTISRDHFGSSLASISFDKFIDRPGQVAPVKKGRRLNPRAPASQSSDETEGSLPFFWAILALGGLGFFSSYLYRGGKEK
jgi:hypothetical protein